MPQPESSCKTFLKRLAPKWDSCACPMGNYHSLDISMGLKIPSDIGRQYFYCNTFGRGPACTYSTLETMSTVLPEADQRRLHLALDAFNKAIKEGHSINIAAKKGKEVYKKGLPIDNGDTVPEIPHASQSQISAAAGPSGWPKWANNYLTAAMKHDSYIKIQGELHHKLYYFLSGSSVCGLTNFPTISWSVYDRFRESFLPIPTFDNLTIVDGEFLIIQPTAFNDQDCEGLNTLITRMRSYNLDTAQKTMLRKRKQDDWDVNEQPRCHQKTNNSPNIEVLDWTNL
ncbi:hypothetical protein CVT25_013258 [Psilocybe cyanescens]|uniref:Uncharacterized protein n=1 Tax=Psilocybe cyanescens TaxID=93625 RepID=A0A409X0V7_PSICY|nr:hypothetical protein CVT25_013258 [Psilocybe cyanescens]